MILRAALSFALAMWAASSAALAGSCNDGAAFGSFFARFASDEQFRSERIVLPLHVLVGSASGTQSEKRWSRKELLVNFNVPVASDQLEIVGLVEETRRLKSGEIEVRQSIPNSDRDNVTYRFKLKQGCWFLVHYEYSSY